METRRLATDRRRVISWASFLQKLGETTIMMIHSLLRRTGLLSGAVALALLSASAPAMAQTAPATKPKITSVGVDNPASMLWVGNSYFYFNNSMHGHVAAMIRATAPTFPFRQTSVTISGAGFGWQDVDSLFRPNAIGAYSFDQNNNVVFNKIDRLFDVAVMMDCSQCPIHPQLTANFHEHAKKNAEIARKNGTKPVFFMSWAYADKPEMTAQLAEAYTKAANDNDVFVIPAGLAFARAMAERPSVNLYDPDKRHPSLAGTYLGAATVYAAVLKKSPVGIKYHAGLGEDTAAFLQRIAQETVQAYHQ
jgi:hypothetical protein